MSEKSPGLTCWNLFDAVFLWGVIASVVFRNAEGGAGIALGWALSWALRLMLRPQPQVKDALEELERTREAVEETERVLPTFD